MDRRINKLQPGQSIEVTQVGNLKVTVERSGNGKVIRFVRHSKDGWVVFRTRSF